ncbi:hypothetical protein [Nostoc sphaeroides]|uniref:PEP-CTERM sorting domain-containing protein n=1 Tax=Nostoc sphaeroides CCNUC1 TaxID=2653204 RepID=A0A5P8WE64_9NOSO|nr:hypothetical protein [Nostoc sphaeroides]QFS51103.1 PEP-CTERM sorting domain-containing protein [Nostoc sphaeroides CCNUC1]
MQLNQAEIEAVNNLKFQGKLRLQIAVFTAIAVTISSQPVTGLTLESSKLGSLSGLPGISIVPDQFLGWRFQVDNAIQVEDIGGHFTGGFTSNIFGTIVSLSSPNAFPQENPLSLEKISLASTTFSVINNNDINDTSVVFLTPLSITLKPGNYALIFGTGLFGAVGTDAMPVPRNQTILPNTSFFFGGVADSNSLFSWKELPSPQVRGDDGDPYFLIKGNIVSSIPEPSSIDSLLILGFLGVSSALLHCKQKN